MLVFGKERDYIIHDERNIKGFFGDYRFLSNFEVCDVYFDGNLYSSTEAAYMSAKTLDPTIKLQFQKSSGIKPAEAKKLGRSLILRSDWELIKYDVMSSAIFDKFYRHKDLRKLLLATGSKYLEETNHWGDIYWGVCDGKGENNLGRILMNIRDFWRGKDKQNPIF